MSCAFKFQEQAAERLKEELEELRLDAKRKAPQSADT